MLWISQLRFCFLEVTTIWIFIVRYKVIIKFGGVLAYPNQTIRIFGVTDSDNFWVFGSSESENIRVFGFTESENIPELEYTTKACDPKSLQEWLEFLRNPPQIFGGRWSDSDRQIKTTFRSKRSDPEETFGIRTNRSRFDELRCPSSRSDLRMSPSRSDPSIRPMRIFSVRWSGRNPLRSFSSILSRIRNTFRASLVTECCTWRCLTRARLPPSVQRKIVRFKQLN